MKTETRTLDSLISELPDTYRVIHNHLQTFQQDGTPREIFSVTGAVVAGRSILPRFLQLDPAVRSHCGLQTNPLLPMPPPPFNQNNPATQIDDRVGR